MHIYTYTSTYIYICIIVLVRLIYMYTYLHVYIHAYYTYIHAYIDTHTHTHTPNSRDISLSREGRVRGYNKHSHRTGETYLSVEQIHPHMYECVCQTHICMNVCVRERYVSRVYAIDTGSTRSRGPTHPSTHIPRDCLSTRSCSVFSGHTLL
jgi:hypothetical protein